MRWRKEKRDPMEFRRKFIWWPIKIIGGNDRSVNWYWCETLLATEFVCHQDGCIRYFKNLDGSDI